MGMPFSASMEESRMEISKNKKKRTLVPSIKGIVWKFQLDISILSIVCTQNKILEPLGKKVSKRPPPPLSGI